MASCRGAGSAGAHQLTLAHGDLIDIDASFSGIKQRNDSAAFKGGRITSTFGGMGIDLSQAVMAGSEARLDISARFSGIALRVPRGWLIVVEIGSLFGGVEDKTVPPMTPGPRLFSFGLIQGLSFLLLVSLLLGALMSAAGTW